MEKINGHLTAGPWTVWGATAEVLSVLESSPLWAKFDPGGGGIEEYVRALDTRTPAEERVGVAAGLIRRIQSGRRLGRWIPSSAALADQEYAQIFHAGYRDHSIHSLHVFLLGAYLYDTVGRLRQALDRHLATKVGPKYAEVDLFLEWWTLAAFWHDFAYPFEAERFIADPKIRERVLTSLSAELLGPAPFDRPLGALGKTLTPRELRNIYQAGRYSPLRIESLEMLLDPPWSPNLAWIDEMWHRLGVREAPGLSPSRELIRLTTTAPVDRPAYYDHGLAGALLLGTLAHETIGFMRNAAEFKFEPGQSNEKTIQYKVLEEWDEWSALDWILRAAVEAIAFHNIDWSRIDPAGRRSLLGDEAARPIVSLGGDPHLFFLAVADTLQDWDRHRFLPPPAEARPVVRAAELLLQGQGDTIRIARAGDHDRPPAPAVRRLFADWLDPKEVAQLFVDGAEFSRPGRVLAGTPVTLSREARSKRERDKLAVLVDKALRETTRLLVEGGDRCVIETTRFVEEVRRQQREVAEVLLPVDREEVERCMGPLLEREQMASTKVKPGVLLLRGQVDSEIGRGGFGKVFRVTERDRSSAFKLMHANDLANTEKRRYFRRGFDAMQKLRDHPNVVQVIEYSEIPVGFYMAYVLGPNLEDGLSQLREVSERLEAALTIAQTLAFAHERVVYHRDVKPGNVILDQERDLAPVLTDFDLAWIDGRSQPTKEIFATAHYGAPELFDERLARHHREPTVDVYGFGALLYYMLTDRTPPPNGAWKEEHWQALERALERRAPATTVNGLLDLIQRATRPRGERLTTMDDVVKRLLSATVASRSARSGSLGLEDWLAEVRYRVSGVVRAQGDGPVMSRTSGTSWAFERPRSTDGLMSLTATCILNRDPYRNIPYDEFQKKTVRSVDKKCREFGESILGASARRHGQVKNPGSSMDIVVEGVPATAEAAAAVGELLASVSRTTE